MADPKEGENSNANDPPANDPPKNDPPANEPAKNDSPASSSGDSDSTKDLRAIVREELAALYKAGEGRGTNRASIEDKAEALVQEAAQRLETKKKEGERDTEITSLKEQVKALTERPPIKQGRLSKALWGDAGKDR